MKNILIILFFCFVIQTNSFAQGTLYLIFDINTPTTVRDVSKYIGWNEPVMSEVGVGKSDSYPYMYFTSYPLMAGVGPTFEKKPNTTPQVISITSISNLYPQALTIGQLDTQLRPLVEDDYYNVKEYVWERKTFQYFDNLAHIYVIELHPTNGQATVVEVEITTTF
jgi:hypothetical protein